MHRTGRRAVIAGAVAMVLAAPAAVAQDGDGGFVGRIAGDGDVFDFTKLDAEGQPLANQDAIYTITAWSCVRDDATGLMWEVKTTDGGLRDLGNTYTWYDPDSGQNAGAPGTQDGGECTGGISCDTHAYVRAANERGLCGFSDWRMPTRAELRTIVAYEERFPAIDTTVFPNTIATSFWTSETNETYPAYAWHTDFKFGLASYYFSKNGPKAVRLVRSLDGS